jgi:hypothetical protein
MIENFISMLEEAKGKPRLEEFRDWKRLYLEAITAVKMAEKYPLNSLLIRPQFKVTDMREFLPFELDEFQNYFKTYGHLDENNRPHPLSVIPSIEFADLLVEYDLVPGKLEGYSEYELRLDLDYYPKILENLGLSSYLDQDLRNKLEPLKDKFISYIKVLGDKDNPDAGYIELLCLRGNYFDKSESEEKSYEIYDFNPDPSKRPDIIISNGEPEVPISKNSLLRFFIGELSEITSPSMPPKKSPKQKRLENFL